MPYRSQGIATTESSKRIELSYFLKNKLIKNNSLCSGSMQWNNRGNATGSIFYSVVFNNDDKYIRLQYSKPEPAGIEKDFDYKVYLIPVKSNLGIGNVYYFQCPVNHRLCRVLYMAYGSDYFQSRQAYRQRIFYNIQTISKKYYSNQRFFDLESQINKLYYEKRYFKESYRGLKTRAFKRIERLNHKLCKFDYTRLGILNNSLLKLQDKFSNN